MPGRRQATDRSCFADRVGGVRRARASRRRLPAFANALSRFGSGSVRASRGCEPLRFLAQSPRSVRVGRLIQGLGYSYG